MRTAALGVTTRRQVFGFIAALGVLLIYLYLFSLSSTLYLFLGAFGVGMFLWATNLSKLKYEEIMLLLMLIVGLALNAVVAGSDITLVGLSIFSFGVASAIVSGDIGPVLSRALYGAFVATVLISILYLHRSLNDVFLAGSRNYISAIGIYFAAVIYLTDEIDGRQTPVLWPSVITFLLSVVAIGRAGILVSALLLMVTVIYRFGRVLRKPVVILGMILVLGGLAVAFGERIAAFAWTWYRQSRFAVAGFDSPRFRMWAEFFSELNLRRAIFGFDLNELPLISRYNGNPHNSFIKIWARAGFAGFFLNGIIVYAVIRMRKRSVFLSLVFALVLLRAAFDIIILINWLDFVIFAYVFYALRSGSSKPRFGRHAQLQEQSSKPLSWRNNQ